MGHYQAEQIGTSGMYRIIDPRGNVMPLRSMNRQDVDDVLAWLNAMLDPEMLE